MQVKLLRVLETGRFHRVGGTETVQVDVRIIAATNKDPREAALSGAFRDDLLYRLAVFPVHVPPLRERGTDVLALAEHFLAELNAEVRDREALRAAHARRAPDASLAGQRPRAAQRRPARVHPGRRRGRAGRPDRPRAATVDGPCARRSTSSVGTALADAQRAIILATLVAFHGDKSRDAASALGVSLKTLYNRLACYGAIRRRTTGAETRRSGQAVGARGRRGTGVTRSTK